jgi:hypothetical protein
METGCGGFGGLGVGVRVGVVGVGDGVRVDAVVVGGGSDGEAAWRSSGVAAAHPDMATLATNTATIAAFPVITSTLPP